MPSDEKHEGLVLRSIDYKDQQKIMTLFTPTRGVISLIVKGINRKKTHLLTLTSPLTQAEYHFRVGRSDLYTFKDGSPINTHHSLRGNLVHIQTAMAFVEAVLVSQLPGKPAPDLYRLLVVYLKHLPDFTDPSSLRASFLLKLLKHDGHLCIEESFSHFPVSEKQILITLTEARKLEQLQELSVEAELQQRIEELFTISKH